MHKIIPELVAALPSFIVSTGVSSVVRRGITAGLPGANHPVKKLVYGVGSLVIAEMLAEKAAEWTDRKIADVAANAIKVEAAIKKATEDAR